MRSIDSLMISAIIPTLNRCNGLGQTLEALQTQALPSWAYEIIVADNGSTDGTQAMASHLAKEPGGAAIHYVREEQLGLHFARHAGARAAHAPILAFIDDDARADRNWLAALLESFADPSVGCVGGRINLAWERQPPRWMERYGPGWLGGLDLGESAHEVDEAGIYGSNLAIRKDVLMQVGGFNPDSFGTLWLGDGETGLVRKVRQAGWKAMYAPRAVVWHDVPAARMTLAYLKRRSANQGASDSYTAYRQNGPGRGRLLEGALEHGAKAAILAALAGACRALRLERRCHAEIMSSYHQRYAAYSWRLTHDQALRRLAEKDDWLEEF